jgi:hypothetical protein
MNIIDNIKKLINELILESPSITIDFLDQPCELYFDRNKSHGPRIKIANKKSELKSHNTMIIPFGAETVPTILFDGMIKKVNRESKAKLLTYVESKRFKLMQFYNGQIEWPELEKELKTI